MSICSNRIACCLGNCEACVCVAPAKESVKAVPKSCFFCKNKAIKKQSSVCTKLDCTTAACLYSWMAKVVACGFRGPGTIPGGANFFPMKSVGKYNFTA